MTEREALAKMVFPRQKRPVWFGGVIQIWVTRACDKACYGCTQGSNLSGNIRFITPEQFEQACVSLKDYFGVVGVFGGNPCLHNQFEELCDILAKYIPFERRGLWSNKLFGKGAIARRTFNPQVSNLNVHLDRAAYDEFKRDWPESQPFGLTQDSRHAPPYVAMKDVLKRVCSNCQGEGTSEGLPTGIPCEACNGHGKVYDKAKAWELISNCDINQNWSAMIGVFRGELRGWFCEIAGAQAMLHQDESDYPDTGMRMDMGDEVIGYVPWWVLPPEAYRRQVRHHCHDCGVPLRGHGMLSQGGEEGSREQVSQTHLPIYNPKSICKQRPVELVTEITQLEQGRIISTTDYVGNATR